MGLMYAIQIDSDCRERTIFRCGECYNHLFTSDNITSSNFRGKHGKGYLVNKLYNYKNAPIEKRSMMTGDYSVCDTHCNQCDHYLGWKYIRAHNRDEIYKEGKFVMEIPQLKPLGLDQIKIKGLL